MLHRFYCLSILQPWPAVADCECGVGVKENWRMRHVCKLINRTILAMQIYCIGFGENMPAAIARFTRPLPLNAISDAFACNISGVFRGDEFYVISYCLLSMHRTHVVVVVFFFLRHIRSITSRRCPQLVHSTKKTIKQKVGGNLL